MSKLDVKEVEKMFVSAIANRPIRHNNDNTGTRINREHHYRFESFGKTLDINSDLPPIEGAFASSMSRDKRIVEVIGGKCIILKEIRK